MTVTSEHKTIWTTASDAENSLVKNMYNFLGDPSDENSGKLQKTFTELGFDVTKKDLKDLGKVIETFPADFKTKIQDAQKKMDTKTTTEQKPKK
jgi:N-acetyl-anhydromuramyl-L-alanine amidase AmpD